MVYKRSVISVRKNNQNQMGVLKEKPPSPFLYVYYIYIYKGKRSKECVLHRIMYMTSIDYFLGLLVRSSHILLTDVNKIPT